MAAIGFYYEAKPIAAMGRSYRGISTFPLTTE